MGLTKHHDIPRFTWLTKQDFITRTQLSSGCDLHDLPLLVVDSFGCDITQYWFFVYKERQRVLNTVNNWHMESVQLKHWKMSSYAKCCFTGGYLVSNFIAMKSQEKHDHWPWRGFSMAIPTRLKRWRNLGSSQQGLQLSLALSKRCPFGSKFLIPLKKFAGDAASLFGSSNTASGCRPGALGVSGANFWWSNLWYFTILWKITMVNR